MDFKWIFPCFGFTRFFLRKERTLEDWERREGKRDNRIFVPKMVATKVSVVLSTAIDVYIFCLFNPCCYNQFISINSLRQRYSITFFTYLPFAGYKIYTYVIYSKYSVITLEKNYLITLKTQYCRKCRCKSDDTITITVLLLILLCIIILQFFFILILLED